MNRLAKAKLEFLDPDMEIDLRRAMKAAKRRTLHRTWDAGMGKADVEKFLWGKSLFRGKGKRKPAAATPDGDIYPSKLTRRKKGKPTPDVGSGEFHPDMFRLKKRWISQRTRQRLRPYVKDIGQRLKTGGSRASRRIARHPYLTAGALTIAGVPILASAGIAGTMVLTRRQKSKVWDRTPNARIEKAIPLWGIAQGLAAGWVSGKIAMAAARRYGPAVARAFHRYAQTRVGRRVGRLGKPVRRVSRETGRALRRHPFIAGAGIGAVYRLAARGNAYRRAYRHAEDDAEKFGRRVYRRARG